MSSIKKQILAAIEKDRISNDKFKTRRSAKIYSLLKKSAAWYLDEEIYILGKACIRFTSNNN